MAAVRILLISQVLACLLVSVLACLPPPVSVKICVPFVGLSKCVDPHITEPKLPPRDNACCGPHCSYAALEPPGCCSSKVTGRCLLDTHCGAAGNAAFYFTKISSCELRSKNAKRLAKGLARLIPFDMNQKTCEAQNLKCGVNCCCRETCPKNFCKIKTVTKPL